MNSNKILQLSIVLCVAIIICVATGAMLLDRNSESTSEHVYDMTGHWYAAYYTFNDENDEFLSGTYITEKNLVKYDMDVLEHTDGTLYGKINGKFFSGVAETSTLTLSFEDSLIVFGNGILANDVLKISLFMKNDDSITVAHVYYTKDSQRPLEKINVVLDVNTLGTWTLTDEKHNLSPLPESIYVYSQKETIFVGMTADIKLKGIIQTNGKISSINMISDTGDIWMIAAKEYEMSATMVKDNDYRYGHYVRGIVEPGRSVYPNITNTLWTIDSENIMDSRGNSSNNIPSYIMEFEKQNGNFVSGTLYYGAERYELIMLISDITFKGAHVFELSALGTKEFLPANTYGIMFEDKMTISTSDRSEGISTSSILHINKKTDSDTDIIGHWYISSIISIDRSEVVCNENIKTDPAICMYDKDILKSTSGLLWAYSQILYTATIHSNNIERYAIYSDGVIVKEKGWISDGNLHTLLSVAFPYGNDKYVTEISFSIYTKIPGKLAVIPPINMDVLGEWNCVSANAYINTGEKTELPGSKLYIDREANNLISGEMEQVIYEEVKYVSVKGIMANYGKEIVGWIIDENGLIWNFSFEDPYWKLYTTNVISQITKLGNVGIVAERIYAKNPGSYTIEEKKTTLKLESNKLVRINEFGNVETVDCEQAIHLTIHNNIVYGWGTMNWENASTAFTFTGYVQHVGNSIIVRSVVESPAFDRNSALSILTLDDAGLNNSMFYSMNGIGYTSLNAYGGL